MRRTFKTDTHDRKVLNKAISITCKMSGWEPWHKYSDRRKNHIRVKFMVNGAPVRPSTKLRILQNAQHLIDKSRAKATVKWEKLVRPGYGSYDALIVRYAT